LRRATCSSQSAQFRISSPKHVEIRVHVGDQDQSRRFGIRGNPQSIVADHLALGPRPGADRPIEFAGEQPECHNLKEISQLGQLPSRLLVFFPLP